MGDDPDEAYSQSKLDHSRQIALCVEYSESFQYITHISQFYQNHYIDHAGPSCLTHDDSLLQDPHEDVDMDQDYPAAPSPHQTPVLVKFSMGGKKSHINYLMSYMCQMQQIVSYWKHNLMI